MIDTATYKTKLEEELALVTKELEGLGVMNPDGRGDWVATPEHSENAADPNVVADVAEDWGERNASLSTLEIRYRNITRALKKIEDGTFGVCEIGGEAIEGDRLDANPAARTCKAHLDDEESLPIQ